jgi:hypothetical protein
MKQLIRKNTFETNSSSMHSLVITKTAKPYTKWEKELDYYGDKFELFGCCDTYTFERHPFEVLSSPKDKLRYYVAHYVGWKQEMHRLDEVEDLVQELTGCSRFDIKLSREEYSWKGELEESYGWAGINDTGEDVFDYIEKNNIPLKEFILDPRYTIIVDGDEYQEFKKLFTKGLIDINNIEYISSGKSFWLDNIKSFSLYYINRFIEDSVYNELMEELCDYNNEFIKCIEIHDEDEDIIYSAMITFASVLECFKNLSHGRNIPIKLVLKNHTKEDYKPLLKYINEIVTKFE